MKAVGQLILVAWLLVALFTFFGNVLKGSFAARLRLVEEVVTKSPY